MFKFTFYIYVIERNIFPGGPLIRFEIWRNMDRTNVSVLFLFFFSVSAGREEIGAAPCLQTTLALQGGKGDGDLMAAHVGKKILKVLHE